MLQPSSSHLSPSLSSQLGFLGQTPLVIVEVNTLHTSLGLPSPLSESCKSKLITQSRLLLRNIGSPHPPPYAFYPQKRSKKCSSHISLSLSHNKNKTQTFRSLALPCKLRMVPRINYPRLVELGIIQTFGCGMAVSIVKEGPKDTRSMVLLTFSLQKTSTTDSPTPTLRRIRPICARACNSDVMGRRHEIACVYNGYLV